MSVATRLQRRHRAAARCVRATLGHVAGDRRIASAARARERCGLPLVGRVRGLWRSVPRMRKTTGAAMRATMRVEREPPAGRGRGRVRGVRLDPLTGRGWRAGGGPLNESTAGAAGIGAGPAGSEAAPGAPMDSRRRRAASGSSAAGGAEPDAGGAPSADDGRGRRVLFSGVSSVTGCPGGRCA